MNSLHRLSVLLLVMILSGCSLLPAPRDETKSWSQQRLFAAAKEAMDESNWEKATTYYDKLLARYPFGRMAQQAFLDKAYCHYRDSEPDAAIATLNRFLKTYPKHPYGDYAYYLKGLANFTRDRGLVERFLPLDESQRDPGSTLDAFNDFAQVLKRYPNGPYAEDARQRMVYLRNNMALHEVNVARWYLRRGAYLAAINRAQNVIKHYQGTDQQRNALQLIITAYDRLGLTDLRDDVIRVMQANFPNADPHAYQPPEPSPWDSLLFWREDKGAAAGF